MPREQRRQSPATPVGLRRARGPAPSDDLGTRRTDCQGGSPRRSTSASGRSGSDPRPGSVAAPPPPAPPRSRGPPRPRTTPSPASACSRSLPVSVARSRATRAGRARPPRATSVPEHRTRGCRSGEVVGREVAPDRIERASVVVPAGAPVGREGQRQHVALPTGLPALLDRASRSVVLVGEGDRAEASGEAERRVGHQRDRREDEQGAEHHGGCTCGDGRRETGHTVAEEDGLQRGEQGQEPGAVTHQSPTRDVGDQPADGVRRRCAGQPDRPVRGPRAPPVPAGAGRLVQSSQDRNPAAQTREAPGPGRRGPPSSRGTPGPPPRSRGRRDREARAAPTRAATPSPWAAKSLHGGNPALARRARAGQRARRAAGSTAGVGPRRRRRPSTPPSAQTARPDPPRHPTTAYTPATIPPAGLRLAKASHRTSCGRLRSPAARRRACRWIHGRAAYVISSGQCPMPKPLGHERLPHVEGRRRRVPARKPAWPDQAPG